LNVGAYPLPIDSDLRWHAVALGESCLEEGLDAETLPVGLATALVATAVTGADDVRARFDVVADLPEDVDKSATAWIR
jgi:hypothetical protein